MDSDWDLLIKPRLWRAMWETERVCIDRGLEGAKSANGGKVISSFGGFKLRYNSHTKEEVWIDLFTSPLEEYLSEASAAIENSAYALDFDNSKVFHGMSQPEWPVVF